MRYCLVNRFRGNWLGSIIGEALAIDGGESERLKILHYQPESWLEPRKSLNPRSWTELKYKIEPELRRDCLAVLLLPLILFYADRQDLLRQIVTQSNLYCSIATEDREDVLAWGNIISLTLREKLNVKHLIKQILLTIEVKNTALISKLTIVEEALMTGKTITSVIEDLSALEQSQQIPLALSLYCFGSTPEDFYLAVSRAARTGAWAMTTAALTGALAGSYNGLTGIPINWRRWGNQNQHYQQIMKQVTNLFYDWCGVYNLSGDTTDFNVVAVPKTIQPRPNLKIISQVNY